jgi:signal transduction histidine kinase
MAVAVFALTWGIVQFRLHALTQRLHERMAERLAERERIAADLHDTLLQSFFGLAVRLQATADQLPKGDPLRKSLDEALRRSDAAVVEGRARIQDLRLTGEQRTSLHEALDAAGCQLASITAISFQMSSKGQPHQLEPSIQEEVFLIGREALTNAFKHAKATVISAEVQYEANSLEVCILDNGQGFEPAVLEAGKRAGHWGLLTMKERARRIHAELKVQGRSAGGTQVHLYVPSFLAYQGQQHAMRGIWSVLPAFLTRRRTAEAR